MENLKKKLAIIVGGKVLDVASGPGNFIPFIKEFRSYDIIEAIDRDKRLLSYFEKEYKDDKKVNFTLMDANKITFPKEYFDTITVSNSLHHFKNPLDTLNYLMQFLEPNGNLIVNEMISDQLNSSQKSHKLLHHWAAKRDRILGNYHRETYTKNEILTILTSLKIKDYDYLTYSLPSLNPQSSKIINPILKIIDHIMEFNDKNLNLQSLNLEGKEIKKYVLENGYSSAKNLFVHLIK